MVKPVGAIRSFAHSFIQRLTRWLIDSVIGRFAHWPFRSLISSLADWCVDFIDNKLKHWSIHGSIDWCVDWFIDSPIGRPIDTLIRRIIGGLIHCAGDLWADCAIVWLQLVEWFIGYCVVGPLIVSFPYLLICSLSYWFVDSAIRLFTDWWICGW